MISQAGGEQTEPIGVKCGRAQLSRCLRLRVRRSEPESAVGSGWGRTSKRGMSL